MIKQIGLVCAVSASIFTAAANAQPWTSANVPTGYKLWSDGCPHRTTAAVLQGKPHISCTPQQAVQPGPPPAYVTATPNQVLAALECDFASATKATAGKPSDLAKAAITGSIKFSLVTKNSKGVSLAIAAIPVFTGASVTPSLDASRLTNTTASDTWTISVDTQAVSACANPSKNNWLTSRVLLNSGLVRVDKFETQISFVVTKQTGAGIKLNIVPVSIGPQVSENVENTHSLSLAIDFTKKKDAPAVTAAPAAPAAQKTP